MNIKVGLKGPVTTYGCWDLMSGCGTSCAMLLCVVSLAFSYPGHDIWCSFLAKISMPGSFLLASSA